MTAQMDRRRLAAIHIIKRELELSDDAYRRILRKVAGVSTSKDLDDAGFHRLMRYLVRSRHYRVDPGGLSLRQKLYLDHLREACGWTQSHFDNFLHKYYHVETLEALSGRAASKVIESMKHIQARLARESGS
jgi:hypothetical protein